MYIAVLVLFSVYVIYTETYLFGLFILACINLILNKNVKIRYNQKLDGQFRKDGSNKKLLKLISDYKFTSFEEGVLKTYEWYGNSR